MKKPDAGRRDFEAAIDTAVRILKAGQGRGSFDPAAKNAGGAMEANFLQIRGFTLLDQDPMALIKKSVRSADAFDALRFGIAHMLRMDGDLPWDVKVWLAQYLTGQVERPVSSGGRKTRTAWDLNVWLVVHMLVENGMTATRNDDGDLTSACDAVAAALKQIGETPSSYKGVKAVWLKMNAKRDADGAFRNLSRVLKIN
jgi:hypothetical protein